MAHSAARTRTDAGVFGSIIAFRRVVAAAEAPYWSRARWIARTRPYAPADPNFTMSASGANTVPSVTVTGPASGAVYPVSTLVNTFSATFTDSDTSSPSAQWSFDTATSVSGTVGAGVIAGSNSFAAAGVYNVTLTFSDGLGGIAIANAVSSGGNAPPNLPATVVVYDPSAGFVTGGGWINSPAGAYASNPSLTGKASFGFVSKYQKGANVPTGETEFNYQVANFNFHASIYQWLVVSGSQAQYKGTGTINGSGSYNFMLTASDGDLNSPGTQDGFRIKITDPNTNAVVYDNQVGHDDSLGNTQAIGGGSIVVHSAK
jgi:hypothetical protein